MPAMTDRNALLAAILAEPADDLHRLAYADWCEESGDDERAEFIRVQVELARVGKDVAALGPCHCGNSGDPTGCSRCRRGEKLGLWQKRSDLRRHERQLLQTGYPKRGWVWAGEPLNLILEASYRFVRGFVADVACTRADWLSWGPALVAAQPVEILTLTDTRAHRRSAGRGVWYAPGYRPYHAMDHGGPGASPGEWWPHLCRRQGADGADWIDLPGHEADAAMSAAALDWARDAARRLLAAPPRV